jgi:hypothetical protein
MFITVYHADKRLIAYETEVAPSIWHTLTIDGQAYTVMRSSSTIVSGTRRSSIPTEEDIRVYVLPHTT